MSKDGIEDEPIPRPLIAPACVRLPHFASTVSCQRRRRSCAQRSSRHGTVAEKSGEVAQATTMFLRGHHICEVLGPGAPTLS